MAPGSHPGGNRPVVSSIAAVFVAVLFILAAGGTSRVPIFGHGSLPPSAALLWLPLAGAFWCWSRVEGRRRAAALIDHDELTGLGSRRSFVSETERALKDARPGGIGLMLYGVEGLRAVNESCGYRAGDELLRRAARQLAQASHEEGSAYRLGSAEFAVVVDRTRGGQLARVVQSIDTFEASFGGCGHKHSIQMTSGFASLEGGDSFDDLYRRADRRLREGRRRRSAKPKPRRTPAPLPDREATPGSGAAAEPFLRTLRLVSARAVEENI